jgi:hypothetical protein
VLPHGPHVPLMQSVPWQQSAVLVHDPHDGTHALG